MSVTITEIPEGTRVGPYTILHPIGRGAQAMVYLAEDHAGRPFAVKVRRRLQDSMDRRFLREFESMRFLRLPGVVQVYQAGIEEGFLWFSMEMVAGEPFFQAIHNEQDPAVRVEKVIKFGRSLLDTLANVHDAGFIHRDVKPSNVLITTSGEVRVLDFGIGRYFTNTDTLSQSGEVLGTVPFMAPEQLAGLHIDGKVDVFATATMLWECIAGKRARPMTTIGWIPRICLEKLQPLATTHREVSLGLSRLIEDMVHVDPHVRPSAREAVERFDRLLTGDVAPEWPTPLFCDPGEWWSVLESALGRPGKAPVWILEGAAGTGKRQIVEQLHRTGLMSGIWPIHLQCKIDAVGSPLEDFLQRLTRHLDDTTLKKVIANQGEMLRRMWPSLTLEIGEDSEPPSTGEIAASITAVVRRCADQIPILLVVHDLERVDTLTARTLAAIATETNETLGIVVIHHRRWETALSRRTIAALTASGAQRLQVPDLDPRTATEIVTSLCPARPPQTQITVRTAQEACELGWRRLADWRGEPLAPFPDTLDTLAVREEPLPLGVLEDIVGRSATKNTWIKHDRGQVSLNGRTAKAAARFRLGSLQKAAERVAIALEEILSPSEGSALLASLWLLAAEPKKAWDPAATAAIRFERQGMYSRARRLLLLLDTLPVSSRKQSKSRFHVAFVQGRVALRTDVSTRHSLVEHCEHLASTPDEGLLARLLRAEYALRDGNIRQALVSSLRVSSAENTTNKIRIRALLVAIQCRIIMGQPRDAVRELRRVEELLRASPDPLDQVRVFRWKTEIAHASGKLKLTRKLAVATIKRSRQLGYVRGVAYAYSRLGTMQRMVGQRRHAESTTRSAREISQRTGDVYLAAESGLALATLLAERGETAGCRHLLQQTVHQIRALRLHHLMPTAMRLALLLSILQGDTAEAQVAMEQLAGLPEVDHEVPATLVRLWRNQSNLDRALEVRPPKKSTYGHCLWRIERARAALSGGTYDLAHPQIEEALSEAKNHSFRELTIYALLIQGALIPPEQERWQRVMTAASKTLSTETYLGSLEMDARRLTKLGKRSEARRQWLTLSARSEELGYRPGMEEAYFWLSDGEVTFAGTYSIGKVLS